MDLWRGGGKLRDLDAGDAGQNGLSALHLSRSATGRAADLRDGGSAGTDHGTDREPAGERGDEDSVRRPASRKITTVDVWTGEIRQVAQPGPFDRLSGVRASRVSLSERRHGARR